jgi:hypothetical protein
MLNDNSAESGGRALNEKIMMPLQRKNQDQSVNSQKDNMY